VTKDQKFTYVQKRNARVNGKRELQRAIARLKPGTYYWHLGYDFPVRFVKLNDEGFIASRTVLGGHKAYQWEFVRTVTPRELTNLRNEINDLKEFYNE
jgi:hypothetical protein